jgi:hypothetical protein
MNDFDRLKEEQREIEQWRFERDMRSFFSNLFVFCIIIGGIWIIISGAMEGDKDNLKKAVVQSELLAKKMEPTVRLEQLALLPDEGHAVTVPTAEYIEKLVTICESKKDEVIRVQCGWYLEQVKIGRDDVTSRVNPIYGRPQFSEAQQKYIRWAENRIAQVLRNFEYQFVRV